MRTATFALTWPEAEAFDEPMLIVWADDAISVERGVERGNEST